MLRRITLEDCFQKMQRGEKIIFVDADDDDAFHRLHVKGARLIPFERIDEKARSYLGLPGLQIVVYSRTDGDAIITRVARRLEELGYCEIFACVEGFEDWRRSGAPVEFSPAKFALNFA